MKSSIAKFALIGICALGVSAHPTATTCTRYSSQTGCPAVYDPCCAFNCIAAGGMFSSCLDFDDTRDQVICSACPSPGAETSAPTTTSAPTSVETTSSAPASTCTPYFLMTGCPQVYDPCCAFNCIAAGGRGTTCLDYDDTRDQVICTPCLSQVTTTSCSSTMSTTAPVYTSTASTIMTSVITWTAGTTSAPIAGNATTSAPILPTPTKGQDSGAAMVSVNAALGLGLLCVVLAL